MGVYDFEHTCDACSAAQAFYHVYITETSYILLCRHHFNRHEMAFVERGYQVIDNSDRLNVRPSVSANAE